MEDKDQILTALVTAKAQGLIDKLSADALDANLNAEEPAKRVVLAVYMSVADEDGGARTARLVMPITFIGNKAEFDPVLPKIVGDVPAPYMLVKHQSVEEFNAELPDVIVQPASEFEHFYRPLTHNIFRWVPADCVIPAGELPEVPFTGASNPGLVAG